MAAFPKWASIARLFIAMLAVPATAQAADRFADPLYVTAEEDQVDPAVNARYTPAFAACQNRAEITSDNDACFVAEFVRQDAVLNHVWKMAFARITGSDHTRLLAAQRAWLAARDPFCRKTADAFSGGTIMPVVYSSCRVELTIRRALWLERLR